MSIVTAPNPVAELRKLIDKIIIINIVKTYHLQFYSDKRPLVILNDYLEQVRFDELYYGFHLSLYLVFAIHHMTKRGLLILI